MKSCKCTSKSVFNHLSPPEEEDQVLTEKAPGKSLPSNLRSWVEPFTTPGKI